MPTEPFLHPITVRYLEVDAQGVVFNMWYLAYFDDAMTAFLANRGAPYQRLMDEGSDVMLVHAELDWRGGVGWGEEILVAVSCSRVGTASFTLDFQVRRAGEGDALVDGRIVYAHVRTDSQGAVPLPDWFADALGTPKALH